MLTRNAGGAARGGALTLQRRTARGGHAGRSRAPPGWRPDIRWLRAGALPWESAAFPRGPQNGAAPVEDTLGRGGGPGRRADCYNRPRGHGLLLPPTPA